MNSSNENARQAATFGHGQRGGLGGADCVSNLNPKSYYTRQNTTKHPVGRRFSQDDIDELKLAMPKVLEYYGVTNPNRSFSSPWREDRNPSASVIPGTYLVRDFGEDVTIDVFGLVEKMEDIHYFPDQVRRVAEIVGYDLDAWGAARFASAPVMDRPRFEVPPVAGFGEMPLLPYAGYMFALLDNDAALSYLRSRGFTEKKAYQNVLGFVRDPTEVSSAFTLYEPNGVLGYLVIPFPVDETFCTVNYAMLRAIPTEMQPAYKEMRPKDVKSPLYREWLVSRRCKVLYVTEGLLDCLALEMLIGKPCLGLGGTGGRRRLASLLYYTKPELRPQKIILALDADDAGRKAAEKLSDDLDCIGIPCSSLQMPEGCKDPNDMLMVVRGLL